MRASEVFQNSVKIVGVPEPMTCNEWAEKNFYLSPESSNTSGRWVSTKPQMGILNMMGNDSIEKLDFFKSARFGGTKMLVIANGYAIEHKMRNVGFYQPTATDASGFVKNEIDPAIRDCPAWSDRLRSSSDKSPLNTLDFKAFTGCNAYYKGGHSPNSFRRLTLDLVMLDELDGFQADIGKEGDATTLSWGRVKNSIFKKQIQISTPTITGFSLIEKNAALAADTLEFKVECPHCGTFNAIEWGGPDVPHGLKWQNRDPKTVLHYCRDCGSGWGNHLLHSVCENGYWEGPAGFKTYDGIEFTLNGEPCDPPRHVAIKCWTAYSPFSPWSQIVEEWYDAQGDSAKLQAFTNTTLGRTWDIEYAGSITKETISSMLRTQDLSSTTGITAGVDIQDDRIEIQYVAHDLMGNSTVLDYIILRGDMTRPDIYVEMGKDIINAKFLVRPDVEMGVVCAAIDTQGHHTSSVHKFLIQNRKSRIFIGINGSGTATYEISDKPSSYKGVKNSEYWSIGVNTIKQNLFSMIRNHDEDKNAYRIWSEAKLPEDYPDQLTSEKMEVKRTNGLDRVVFTNEKGRRNEALDTLVYAIAAKAYVRDHRGRLGRAMFGGT